jgi:hypothetical protein
MGFYRGINSVAATSQALNNGIFLSIRRLILAQYLPLVDSSARCSVPNKGFYAAGSRPWRFHIVDLRFSWSKYRISKPIARQMKSTAAKL